MASFKPQNYGMKLPSSYSLETEKSFEFQDVLPSLPVPPLTETLTKYLASTKPFLTTEEFHQTQFIVQQFGNGIGKVLHRKLLEKANHHRNWIEQLWEDNAYLYLRTPHAPFLNFAGPAPYIETFWPPKDGTQVERASLMVWFALKFWEMLRRERLRVDRGPKQVPWCMHQYKRMFNGCKTPGKDLDKLNDYFKTDAEGKAPDHIVVFCRGRMFTFSVLDPEGQIMTAPELQAQLQHIRDICDRGTPGPALGAMTADHRPRWTEIRSHLIDLHPDNERHLTAIQTAIFGIALDDRSPRDQTELVHESLLGDCTNRWFDKSFTFIAYKNGCIGCNCDHSPHEAMVMVACTVWTQLGLENSHGTWRGPTNVRDMPKPDELVFCIDGTVINAIAEAKKVYEQAIRRCDLQTGRFTGFGKDQIKKFKIHPDTFVQLALQYSYYKLYKKPAPTYETASARKFYRGRTETIRVCTVEACDWTKAMVEDKLDATQKMRLLLAAVSKHDSMRDYCQEGLGCDRHLLGLLLLAAEEGLPTPQIFTDPAFTKSGGGGNFKLSSSFLGYTSVYGGVLPMCENGYGVFYCIESNRLSMFCSSWTEDTETDSARLIEAMKESLQEMGQVAQDAASASKL